MKALVLAKSTKAALETQLKCLVEDLGMLSAALIQVTACTVTDLKEAVPTFTAPNQYEEVEDVDEIIVPTESVVEVQREDGKTHAAVLLTQCVAFDEMTMLSDAITELTAVDGQHYKYLLSSSAELVQEKKLRDSFADKKNPLHSCWLFEAQRPDSRGPAMKSLAKDLEFTYSGEVDILFRLLRCV